VVGLVIELSYILVIELGEDSYEESEKTLLKDKSIPYNYARKLSFLDKALVFQYHN